MTKPSKFENPFRPGAGHAPPYLAGRQQERQEFDKLLGQTVILQNLVLTGLRGVGKTVLLVRLKPAAMHRGWLWAGTYLSESSSVSEEMMAIRVITDLSVVTAPITVKAQGKEAFFRQAGAVPQSKLSLDYRVLRRVYEETAGLV